MGAEGGRACPALHRWRRRHLLRSACCQGLLGAACDLDRSREAPFTSDGCAFGSVPGRQSAQRGELQGALEGLRRLREPCASITLATDSAYLLRGLAAPGPRLRSHDLWSLLHQQVARLTAAEVPIYLLKVR